jgi:tRNA 2-thiouridine synthesizing protein A
MSASWLGRRGRGRPAGRHAAPRGRAVDSRDGDTPAGGSPGFFADEPGLLPAEPGFLAVDAVPAAAAGRPAPPFLDRPPTASAPAPNAGFLGAPPMADAVFISQVTDAARAAVADTAVSAVVPPGAEPVMTIDALGRKCPIPIIMLAARIVEVPVGSVIAVLADDPAAYTDVPAWCGLKSHDCVFRVDLRSAGWAFGVSRRY